MVTCKPLDIEYLKKLAKQSTHKIRECDGKKITVSNVQRARRILKILERDKFKCVKCPKIKYLTIDHITKALRNGKGKRDNQRAWNYKLEDCQTLCVKCHREKNREDVKNGNKTR